MIHQVRLGRFHLCSIQLWPVQQMPASEVLTVLDAASLERARARQPQYFGGGPMLVEFALNVFVLRSPGLTVLVDTGEAVRRGGAVLSWGLATLGIGPEDINLVFLTHRDDDHAGGTVDEQGEPRFPRARYLMARDEYTAYRAEPQRARAFQAGMQPLEDRGLLDLFDGEAEIAPGLTAVPTPGHRSGATSLRVQDGFDTALILADTLHLPVQVTHPQWSSVWDADADRAATTRCKVIERAAREGWLLAAPHIPYGGLGFVRREAGEWVWAPLE